MSKQPAYTKEQEDMLRRRAIQCGYRLHKRKSGWSLVAVATGEGSSLREMDLDQVAELLYSVG